MQDIKHEIEIHGLAVHAGKNLDVTPKDECASITLNRGERELRFPFSTPTIVNGQRLKAGKLFVRFTTYDSSRISFIKIMDGDKMIVLQDDLNWQGVSTTKNYVFQGAPIGVEWGLNVIIGVDSNRAPAQIDIIGLGVVFY
ncbi:uncharacterized protein Aud_009491 [Aspergillus udagawae]|uniref:Uncharacterized protein n=1 Tax=Aspergillus udagawae TaxID=91492 RepID=A0A8E0V0V6_9EURO|nr:uncharacterized protein Aud_009491 [Aspergillus udagawae]GIC93012.1 hypothetical protein Aud_009491 [Aspergillus udagawae]